MSNILLIGLVVVWIVLALWVWSLCRAAALGDRHPKGSPWHTQRDKRTCRAQGLTQTQLNNYLTPYRRHLHRCRTCDPPHTLCGQGTYLRQWCLNLFVERRGDV